MSDQIGDDRPPSRRAGVVTALLVLALAAWALSQHLSASGEPGATPEAPSSSAPPPPPSSSPTPPSSTAVSSPGADVVAPAVEPHPRPAPWAGLATARRTDIDYAQGRVVHADGHTYRLASGDLVLTMDRAAGGPVVLVQSRGTTVLQQLRPDGSRLLLDRFTNESRLPQGEAVDPSGRRIAYALTSALSGGPTAYGLVVRDLATGAVLVELTTKDTYAVRDWTSTGVVLTVARDPGGPPLVWHPDGGRPTRVTPFSRSEMGPFLLAASPVRPEWAVTANDCTGVVRVLGQRPAAEFCRVVLGEPAAWSPSGDRIAARGDRPVVRVLDLRTGRTWKLALPPRLFVAQIEWIGDDTVLVAVHTLSEARGALLACQVSGPCRRLRLGTHGRESVLVLAR